MILLLHLSELRSPELGLGSKHYYLQSHLTGPTLTFEFVSYLGTVSGTHL